MIITLHSIMAVVVLHDLDAYIFDTVKQFNPQLIRYTGKTLYKNKKCPEAIISQSVDDKTFLWSIL